MNLRFTPRALREAKRIRAWWRKNRSAAIDLLEFELEQVLARLLATPTLGVAYGTGRFGLPVFRVLLPKTENHVYYAVEADEIVVLSIWALPRSESRSCDELRALRTSANALALCDDAPEP
jgi:plasmid stabilization system protein ParE